MARKRNFRQKYLSLKRTNLRFALTPLKRAHENEGYNKNPGQGHGMHEP